MCYYTYNEFISFDHKNKNKNYGMRNFHRIFGRILTVDLFRIERLSNSELPPYCYLVHVLFDIQLLLLLLLFTETGIVL